MFVLHMCELEKGKLRAYYHKIDVVVEILRTCYSDYIVFVCDTDISCSP